MSFNQFGHLKGDRGGVKGDGFDKKADRLVQRADRLGVILENLPPEGLPLSTVMNLLDDEDGASSDAAPRGCGERSPTDCDRRCGC